MKSETNNVVSLFKTQAERVPSRVAFYFPDGTSITYAELEQRSLRFGAGLQASGLKAGDRLLGLVPMSCDLYTMLIGTLAAGGALVFIDPWIGRKQIARFAAYAELRGLIGVPKAQLLRLMDAGLRALPLSVTTGSRWMGLAARYAMKDLLAHEPLKSLHHVENDDAALITFTSGSSGEPKGANRTHHFLASQHRALKANFAYEDDDVDMTNFPVFALNNLAMGLPTVVPDAPLAKIEETNAARLLQQMNKYKVTTCTFSPPLVDKLADALEAGGSCQLRRVLVGGAAISDAQLKRWMKLLPNTEIQVVYGSTEAEPVAHMEAGERLSHQVTKAGAVGIGHVVEQVEAHVIAMTHESVKPLSFEPLPAGEIGELVVSGEHVCRSYYKNEAAVKANKILLDDGRCFHRMGDTGYFDEQRIFHLTGRLHSTIRLADGSMLQPMLCEASIRERLAIEGRMVLLGVGNWANGQALHLVIENAGGVHQTDELAGKLLDLPYEIEKIHLTSARFPVDPRHRTKVDYAALKQMLGIGDG